ncbi:hypothetical protein FNB79_02540 [Formosa sediminum]|uniref:Uncharacterized protein n=1 Tax=Formosa sediminum TaxID=2594004 RepID=A0A516GN19_9FLAO|nr:hypothetical protein [Formosa sediminum]QDO92899.1 hypothetical protein FNB79_02540 [Formosa sediminum]
MKFDIQLSDVTSIRLDIYAYNYGSRGQYGAIYVDLKEAYEYNNDLAAGYNYFENQTDFGFTEPTLTFERPLFTFNTKESKQFYNTLDWIPNFNISPNTLNNLKVY